MTERVIGIDLGTTNSCVAIVEDGNAKVIPNRGSYDTTPSIVAIAETGRRLVGHMAKRQAITNASNTAFAFKRLIGRAFDSPEVANLLTTLPYKIVSGPNKDIRIVLRDTTYSISELSAFVLQEMKAVAEEYLNAEVTKAVVTVPAYFGDSQRQATRDAGKIAGLEVIRIINEPTAAALAYGYGKDLERRVAIFDLGGGTFDISVLDIGNGVFEVITTAGDSLLGGEDFDRRIMDWLVFNFAKEYHIDLRKDKMALQRLKDVSEKSKCDLSGLQETEISLPFITSTGKSDPFHLQTVLTREKLEQLTGDLVERTIRICDESLKKGGIDLASIDTVILVGGMTRMPIVQRRVHEFFGKEPSKGVHPDEVVAIGAAIQGNALLNTSETETELLLLDVTSHSLGIKMADRTLYKLIESNTTIPTSHRHIFTTVRDNQEAVTIIVLQGEHEEADLNDKLGEFTLTGLRRAKKGEVDIEVDFEVDANGIMKVTARDLGTGKEQAITISAQSKLSEEELRGLVAKNSPGADAQSKAPSPQPQPMPSASTFNPSPAMAPPVSSSPQPSAGFEPTAPLSPHFMGMDTRQLRPDRVNQASTGRFSPPSSSPLLPGDGSGEPHPLVRDTPERPKRITPTIPMSVGATIDEGAMRMNAARSTPHTKLHELVADVTRLLPDVERLIAHTSYGPEALKRARTNLDNAKRLLSTTGSPTTDVSAALQDLERTSTMFQNILSRLKGS
ncbi:molecular chaperone DnaK [Myxococcota bacterium]|nr:molecular chaperone DnaK [Myxococcota bacterium]